MARVLLIRPDGDHAERILGSWADGVAAILPTDRQSDLADLRGSAVTRENVLEALAGCDVAVYFGHGTASGLGADGGLLRPADIHLTSPKVLVAFACYSVLPFQSLVANGRLRAVLGFDDLLIFPTLPGPASVFPSLLQEPLTSFLWGDTTIGDLHGALRDGFQRVRERFRSDAARHQDPYGFVWTAAHANRRTLALRGDAATTIASE